MRRLALLAGLGILLVGAGATSFIVWHTGLESEPQSPAEVSGRPAAAAPSSTPNPIPEARAVPDPAAPPRRPVRTVRAPPPAALGKLGSRLARCMSKDDADLPGSLAQSKPAVVMVVASTEKGGLRIDEVPRDANPLASDLLLACAREAVRGHVVPARGAVPGKRVRIGLPVRRPSDGLIQDRQMAGADEGDGADPDHAPAPDPEAFARAHGVGQGFGQGDPGEK